MFKIILFLLMIMCSLTTNAGIFDKIKNEMQSIKHLEIEADRVHAIDSVVRKMERQIQRKAIDESIMEETLIGRIRNLEVKLRNTEFELKNKIETIVMYKLLVQKLESQISSGNHE